MPPLTPDQARRVYDRIGRVQDWQAFYEDATTDRLMTAAALGGDQRIFEFGCGTGRLAERLLRTLPANVTYRGVDLSPMMINLAVQAPHCLDGPGRRGACRRVTAPPRR